MADPDELRRMNHSRTPVVRSQICGLRSAAKHASEKSTQDPANQMGFALTSNILMGFALELGLKLFFLSYYNKDVRGHSLTQLFSELPQKIRNDIAISYQERLDKKPLIQAFAITFSRTEPDLPTDQKGSVYSTAEDLFQSTSHLFVRTRYLFEEIGSVDWAMFDLPTHYLLTMSEALDAVYDEYVRRGGWT